MCGRAWLFLTATLAFGSAASAEGVVIHRMAQAGAVVTVTASTELAPIEEAIRREGPRAVEAATRDTLNQPLRPAFQVSLRDVRIERGSSPTQAIVLARWRVDVSVETPRIPWVPPRRVILLRDVPVETVGVVTLVPETTSLLRARVTLRTVRVAERVPVDAGGAPLGVIDIRPGLTGALAERPIESLQIDSIQDGRVMLTVAVRMPTSPASPPPPQGDEPVLPPE